ncbi:TPA: 1-deoxy-D-xylulose-5-phosphate synthase [candidate division WOR-3]|uniref:1-deoxy-D-xylulose-5-phosphate synthase n=1 Tax=candidate division WOR-3 bacterium TaxID=2052148 RepID=A0A348MKV5_UNCW3|nr:1-deoxy-D-xylulose-5-phosphate synthase [candidate division WOR-3 bacterium]HCP17059.1 1-deoxy-D-xylulose-5-phosphate synthase [candidate division WOR-3 bacterium]
MLKRVNSPKDLKELSIEELYQLASDIRYFIIENTSKTGGHLAPSLGAVELIISLHYVFSSPKDKIIFDVGHQSYAHKILTGRKDRFSTLRTYKGISGFNNIFESEHDQLTVGHAGTSLSAALGMAVARDLKKEKFEIINVIGDGSMTNGLVYEALNNLATLKNKVIIVLNDNNMSISQNVGGISQYLNKLQRTPVYTNLKNDLWQLMGKLPDGLSQKTRDIARRMKESLKNFFIPTIFFEEFGVRYLGPFDGHKIEELITTFKYAKDYPLPILIHVITQKGRGYIFAEKDPTKFHGLGKFDKETGLSEKTSNKPKYTDVFGKSLTELAKKNDRIIGITAAMPDGTGLSHLRKEIPERFFDVGIAEEHAVLFSVGLSLQGFKPVCAIYSTFLQRGYDQLIHDVSLMKRNIFFVLDRAGIVGDDGPTHHGLFDLSYLRTVPDMVIMSPKDEDELRSMVKLGIEYNEGPIALRYPRGEGYGVDISNEIKEIEFGKGEIILDGEKIIIVAIGSMVYPSKDAALKIQEKYGFLPTVINARFLRPFDSKLLFSKIKNDETILTVEENILSGGFGEYVRRIVSENGYKNRVINIGINDKFVEMGSVSILKEVERINEKSIFERLEEIIDEKHS